MKYRVLCPEAGCLMDAKLDDEELAHILALAHQRGSGHVAEVQVIRESPTSNPEGGKGAREGSGR